MDDAPHVGSSPKAKICLQILAREKLVRISKFGLDCPATAQFYAVPMDFPASIQQGYPHEELTSSGSKFICPTLVSLA